MSGRSTTIRVIDADAVHAALSYDALIDALGAAFAAMPDDIPPRAHHHLPPARPGASDGTLLVMPAWNPRAIGLKVVGVMPDNPGVGLPTVIGSYLLLDRETSAPLALLDGAAITQRRTACASALAARHLARADARTLLVIGAGALALHLIRAHVTFRPGLARIRVWARRADAAQAVIDALTPAERAALDVAVVSPDALDAAVADACIISAATRATVPLIRGQLVAPGTHLDLVGAYMPAMCEADAEAVARADVFVDGRDGAAAEAGDLIQAVAAGRFAMDRIAGDLADLSSGRHPGRRDGGQVTLFKSVGHSLEDLVAAELALRRATGGA
ncbi:ornithine cyclodeaminase [Tistrella bauzanensis]|uniref:Ornithine cyclodeaminase n=1 Tax=Tistrella bauzanensis TaxID=657419 RepID=A0ABQ1IC57_9PROT|nr:ornithine cyclodeaminase family protein [Tistrella bauzanensis]GGB34346.1 ornithine cyclodeaminase [Tistrella bauzanensis]